MKASGSAKRVSLELLFRDVSKVPKKVPKSVAYEEADWACDRTFAHHESHLLNLRYRKDMKGNC